MVIVCFPEPPSDHYCQTLCDDVQEPVMSAGKQSIKYLFEDSQVEELLELLIAVVNAKLLKAVRLKVL